MKYIKLTSILLFFSIVTINAQNTIDLNLLNGEWAGKEIADTTDEYKEVIGASITKVDASHLLHFLSTSSLSFKENTLESSYSYTVVNETLKFSNKEYKLLELSSTTLKIQEVGNSSNTILYFNKLESGGY